LATAQLAGSLALLVGALLFLSTLRHLRGVDLGIDPSGVTMTAVQLRSYGYDQTRALAYHVELLERLRREPGIDHVAITYNVPVFGGNLGSRVYLPGQNAKTDILEITMNGITSTFFDVFRMKLLKGRAFTDAETSSVATTGSPVILSATAARRLFGDTDPMGKLVMEPRGKVYSVIGVAADVRWETIIGEPDAVMYQPWATFELNNSQAMVAARSSNPTADVARRIRHAATSIDPSVPLFPERTMSSVIDRGVAEQRLFARVLGLLGIIAFVLAAVGLHGLISQMVKERSREFGIRMAVGASQRNILGLLMRQAAIVTGAGITIGLTAAAFGGRVIEASLFGVTSRDPFIYASAAALLLVVVALALIGPARAALRVPLSVLRSE
jgi:putative ABC transport system permease protein